MNKPDKNDIIEFLKCMRDRCATIECIECDMAYSCAEKGISGCVTSEMLAYTISLITGIGPSIKYAMPICHKGTDEKFCSNCGESIGVAPGPVCKKCHYLIREDPPFANTVDYAREVRVINASGKTMKTIIENEDGSIPACPITIVWCSKKGVNLTGNGVLSIKINGEVKANLEVPQGEIIVDLAPYLEHFHNKIDIAVYDVYGDYRSIRYEVFTIQQ